MMKMIGWVLPVLAFVGFAMSAGFNAAHAEQGCPDGMMPNPIGAGGQKSCVPGRAQTDWGDGAAQQAPSAQWDTRWGAIAYDGDAGKYGTARAMKSKRKAEKAALAHCASKGADKCKIVLTYYNQCGAVAFADGNLVVAHAPTDKEAEASAMEGCADKAGSGECKIYYSDCSYAERVR